MSTTTEAPVVEAPPKKSRKKLVIVLVVALLLVGGAVYQLVLKPPSAEASKPVPGEVVALEPVQINLAAGHYLRIGIALQLVEGGHEIDGSQALDALIELFSGREVGELGQAVTRENLKEKLDHELHEAYHGEVMDVYFTEFVTQ